MLLALAVLATVCRALNLVSSCRSSEGGDSTLLELSFDQDDLPFSQAEGVLQFQVEGAAIGAGLRGLLHRKKAIAACQAAYASDDSSSCVSWGK
eukprot:g22571.t1